MDATQMVKVKMLKHVGAWAPGDEIEVEADVAEALCQVSLVHDGVGLVEHRKAMRLEEAEALAALPHDISQLTAGEAAALGLKNVVELPDEEAAPVEGEAKKSRGRPRKQAE